MTDETASDLVAARVREVRKARRWRPADLAARCQNLSENSIENIESGRRDKGGRRRRAITLEELLELAYALDIAPVHLLAGLDDSESFPVTPSLSLPAAQVRQWIRGWPYSLGLPGTDQKRYIGYVPASEDDVHYVPHEEYQRLMGGGTDVPR